MTSAKIYRHPETGDYMIDKLVSVWEQQSTNETRRQSVKNKSKLNISKKGHGYVLAC